MDEEYRTMATGAGWWDRSMRGRIRFEGPDAAAFLQALLSNDVQRLSRGDGVYATYLTPQGRMVADLDVLHRGDSLLALVGDGLGPMLAARFDQLIFSEALTVTDVSTAWAEIAVAGGAAVARLASVLALDPAALGTLSELSQLDTAEGFVMRAGEAPFPMFVVVTKMDARETLLARLASAGVVPISPAVVEALRVEAGRAAWGPDLTTDTIPLEAGLLDRAISTNKGCYVGQEIIVRILHRGGGRVARRLAMLAVDATAVPPAPGTALRSGEQTVGHVTSAVFSPARAGILALGYVQRDSAEPGRVFTLEGSSATATIVGFAS